MSATHWNSNRRTFLTNTIRGGTAAILSTAFPLQRVHALRDTARLVGLLDATPAQLFDPVGVRTLALRAIDAAKSAGAQYADVRLTRTVRQGIRSIGTASRMFSDSETRPGLHDNAPSDHEEFAVGVRALVDGCWGFAASPFWSLDEMSLLAREAIIQATANAEATPRRVELAPVPVATGHWRPDGAIDPFSIPPEERIEAIRALADYPGYLPPPTRSGREDMLGGLCEIVFTRQESALATSEGTYCTQERFSTDTQLFVGYSYGLLDGGGFGMFPVEYPRRVGQGWEAFDMARAKRCIDAALERFYAPRPPRRGVEVGRYDVVCSGAIAAQFIDRLLGAPTELDRALGYEANAGGTSYLEDPLAMVGQLKLGAPMLTVTANRSLPGGLATVKWDDEGVEPAETTLVKDGILTDFQTTRESATWLAEYYAKRGRTMRSGGSAASESALSFTLGHTPNLVMQPGRDDTSFDALVRSTQRGIAILDGTVSTDFQGRTGVCRGSGNADAASIREIVDGKLGDVIENAGMLFDATSFWTTLVGIGGAGSEVTIGAASTKGEPSGTTWHTVSAVPFKVRDAAIIDLRRRW